MSDLVVLAFPDENGALRMRDKLFELQKQHLILLGDAAVVIRKPDGDVKVKQAVSLVGAGALGGAFWGLLIGMIFWMPWLGAAMGAISGAIGGKFRDIGIDDNFIKEVGSSIEPGNSALFLLVISATEDKVLEELKDFNATVLRTSLSKEDESKLRSTFASEEIEA